MTQTPPPNYPNYPEYPAAAGQAEQSAAGHNPWAAPPYGGGYAQGQYPTPYAEPPRSVRGLGVATQIMLAVVFVANIALLFPTLNERSLFQKLRSDPSSVSVSEANDADNTLNALSVASTLLYIATGIVWIIWFYRVRKNVEAWQPIFQRRARGWAIGGFFCPVVNLWFPAMMAKDILDDTTKDPARPVRQGRPLVVAWGIGFALMIISSIALRGAGSSADRKLDSVLSTSDFRGAMDAAINETGVAIFDIIVTVLTAIPAVLLVREITNAQSRRMTAVQNG